MRSNKNQREFDEQLRRNREDVIAEFKSAPEYSHIKEFYRDNFDKIYDLISKFGSKSAIEDIANLSPELKDGIINNVLLLKEINRAILDGDLHEYDL